VVKKLGKILRWGSKIAPTGPKEYWGEAGKAVEKAGEALSTGDKKKGTLGYYHSYFQEHGGELPPE
jgi:hypothetical protein